MHKKALTIHASVFTVDGKPCYTDQSFFTKHRKENVHMMKVVEKMLDWENAGKLKLLSVGYSLREPELLFRKIEDAEITEQVEKLKAGF